MSMYESGYEDGRKEALIQAVNLLSKCLTEMKNLIDTNGTPKDKSKEIKQTDDKNESGNENLSTVQ